MNFHCVFEAHSFRFSLEPSTPPPRPKLSCAGRTSKQCRERWCHHLDPSINKGAYTPAEDKIIIEMQAKIGNKWSQIAARLPGRTENSIKIRCKALQRKGTGSSSRSSTNSSRTSRRSDSASSKSRRRQSSSSSITSATSGVSAADSAMEQQLPEGGKDLPEDSPPSPQTDPRSCPPHIPSVDKFELLPHQPSEISRGHPQQSQMFMQRMPMGEAPSSNPAATFSETSDAMGVAMGVSTSAGLVIPPTMSIPRPESENKRWIWPRASGILEGVMNHSGMVRGWPSNSVGEATVMPVKQEAEVERLPCLSSAMYQHLIDRPASCAIGGGGGVNIAPFDGTTVPSASFPGSSSCGDFEQAPLGQYFTPGLNTAAAMQQETVRMSPELTSIEQACGIPNPAPGTDMVLSARSVDFPAAQPIITPEKERVGASFGDFSALSLEDLRAAVGGEEEDAAAPLRSCCSFLDLPEVVGENPLSW